MWFGAGDGTDARIDDYLVTLSYVCLSSRIPVASRHSPGLRPYPGNESRISHFTRERERESSSYGVHERFWQSEYTASLGGDEVVLFSIFVFKRARELHGRSERLQC